MGIYNGGSFIPQNGLQKLYFISKMNLNSRALRKQLPDFRIRRERVKRFLAGGQAGSTGTSNINLHCGATKRYGYTDSKRQSI